MSGAAQFRVTRRLNLSLFLVVVALVSAACFPGEDPGDIHDGLPVLRIFGDGFFDLPEGAPVGHSVVFSEIDATRVGVPVENELLASASGVPTLALEMEAFFIGDLENSVLIELGCFDPIEIRNNGTGEVDLSIVEYCPAGARVSRNLYFRGVSTETLPGWTYDSGDDQVVVNPPEGE